MQIGNLILQSKAIKGSRVQFNDSGNISMTINNMVIEQVSESQIKVTLSGVETIVSNTKEIIFLMDLLYSEKSEYFIASWLDRIRPIVKER